MKKICRVAFCALFFVQPVAAEDSDQSYGESFLTAFGMNSGTALEGDPCRTGTGSRACLSTGVNATSTSVTHQVSTQTPY